MRNKDKTGRKKRTESKELNENIKSRIRKGAENNNFEKNI